MRKFIIVICLLLTFLFVYFLQSNIFNYITIGGIKPNLFVILVLFIGLFTNSTISVTLGVIFGIIIDFSYGKTIGITAIMLCSIGYMGAYFDRNFSKENKITIIVMTIIATIIFEFGYYFLNILIIGFENELVYFTKILIIEVLYNVLLTIILYPLIQKIGYSLDRGFKRTNILTRYF